MSQPKAVVRFFAFRKKRPSLFSYEAEKDCNHHCFLSIFYSNFCSCKNDCKKVTKNSGGYSILGFAEKRV